MRVLDSNGRGTVSGVVAGIQWVIQNQAAYNIRVMNLSMGHPVGESYASDPLCQAVEAAWKSGIVVVCAAGNAGRTAAAPNAGARNEGYGTEYGSIMVPGNDPCVITVGAMKAESGRRADDRIATYSSRGPSRLDFVLKPDLVAPGNRVISLRCPNSTMDTQFGSVGTVPFRDYRTSASTADSPQYFRLSGTSMAAPVVAGAAALLLQADPSLTPDAVKARLMVSADRWPQPDGTMDPCTFGAGYLNIPAALGCAFTPPQPAVSPTLVRDTSGSVCIGTTSWGSNVLWGTVSDLQQVWGQNVLWGTSTLAASSVLWGANCWEDNVLWGTGGPSDLAIYGEN